MLRFMLNKSEKCLLTIVAGDRELESSKVKLGGGVGDDDE